MSEIPGMPDWPVLKHLTWREAHLFELGIWPGIGVALAMVATDWAAALALVAVIRRRMHAKDQHRNSDDLVKGYIRDAWYFGVGALFGLLVGYTLAMAAVTI